LEIDTLEPFIPFKNREEAGQKLATLLSHYKKKKDTLVLGLARGGVVVAKEIAKILLLPLQALVPRKLGSPGNPELALGAVTEFGDCFFNGSLIKTLDISQDYLDQEIETQKAKIQKRISLFQKEKPWEDVKGKTVILVDDGMATGATMIAEIQSMRQQKVKHLVLAIPVASLESWEAIQPLADEPYCLCIEPYFLGVSGFYIDFSEVTDENVLSLLHSEHT
jgi:putative phosphoribosyl transferase